MSSPNLLSAVRAMLQGTPSLSALSGVYLDESPRPPVYPFLVISFIDARPVITTDIVSYWEPVLLQFTVIATNANDAAILGAAAFEAMSMKLGNPTLVFDDGYQMARLPGKRRGPYRMPGLGTGDTYLYAYMFEYRIQVGRDY